MQCATGWDETRRSELVNVFFFTQPTAKIDPRELIASSRGLRINLQKVPLFGHFGPKMLMGWSDWPAR